MLNIEDLESEEFTIQTISSQDAILDENNKMLNKIGFPVLYNQYVKKAVTKVSGAGIGVIFDINDNVVSVLYKGFLLKDPIKIPAQLSEKYIQLYVLNTFKKYKQYVKSQMPRVKYLKRLNLKMLTLNQSHIIYDNLDIIIDGYEQLFGYEYAYNLKAQIVTTPFYVLDNNTIKVYHFDINEAIEAEFEGANFLCYFTYKMTK